MIRVWLAAGPLLAALAVRLYRLDAHGLWADEAMTVSYASLPLGQIAPTIAAHDPHPPLFYLLLAAWLPLAGQSDYAARFPSALFGVLAVAALCALGRRVRGPGVAALAGLFAALNPLLVWYGQEARGYALHVLGVSLSVLALHRARQQGSARAWLGHSVALAVTLHVHYFAAFVAGWHALLIERATRWRPDRWRALGALALGAAAFVPWLLATDTLGYQGWMEPVDLETAARRAAWAFAVGTSIYPEWGWPLAAPTLAAAALGLLALAIRRRSADLLLIGGWAIVPVAAAYAFGAVTGRPSFHERYVIAGAPAVMLLAALGIAATAGVVRRQLAARPLGAVRLAPAAAGAIVAPLLLAGILAADARSLVWHFGDPHFAKEDVRAAARFIDARSSPEDGLLASPGRANLYARYARRPLPTLVTDVSADEVEPLLEAFVVGRSRIWYLPGDAEVDRRAEDWLDARGYRLDDRWFGLAPFGSWVFAADPPGPGLSAELTRGGAPVARVSGLRHAVEPSPDGRVLRVVGEWARQADAPPLRASLRLVDSRERAVAQRDLTLDERSPLRFALRVPPEVPGGRYGVRLVVYADEPLHVGDDAELRLGDVDLTPRAGTPDQVEPAVAADGRLGDTLRLIGHELPTAAVPAGGRATAVLHWQATGSEAWSALIRSRLHIDGVEVAAAPDPEVVAGAAPGGVLREARELRLPRTLAAGSHRLVARLGADELTVGRVDVVEPVGQPSAGPTFPTEATFGPAELIGFDATGQARPSGRVAIGLHFAPRQPFQRDLKVFVHLVDAGGKIVAQHDSQPCGGGCPTSTWRGGERIRSEHPLELPPELPAGRYAVVVGLYDAQTGDRVPRAGPTPPGQSDRAVLGEITIAA